MYSPFTGLSKEKKKLYFQFCKIFGAAQACAQLSFPQKHPVGPISSEVLCKTVFITHQPVVASQSSVALGKGNGSCQASGPKQMAAAC